MTRLKGPTFGLADIPDNWEIELNADFVKFLDMVNRPWKYTVDGSYNPKGRHHPGQSALFWEAGYYSWSRKRMRHLITSEYVKRHNFFEKLWGYHRYHDAHVARYGHIKKVDTGNWIVKSELEIIRAVINMTDEDFEEVITGFRKGIWSNNVRALHFKRLPINGNKSWAWLLGFYFATGTIYLRERYYDYSEGPTVRLRAVEDVLPKLAGVIKNIGARFIVGTQGAPKEIVKDIGIGTTPRRYAILGRPTYLVLVKMGLPTDFLAQKLNRSGSRSIKPRIPTWIKNNDAFMTAFIEGFTNAKAASVIVTSVSTLKRPIPHLVIFLRMIGEPEGYVKQFIGDIQNWFLKQGIIGKARKVDWYTCSSSGVVQYELAFHNKKAYEWMLKNLDIRRPCLRARLVLFEEARKRQVLYEILRVIKSPDDIILGMILEQPRTWKGFENLQMRKEGVAKSLLWLQNKGIIVKKGETFVYSPEKFKQESIEHNREIEESATQRYLEYSTSLLLQCKGCGMVYAEQTSCSCGGSVEPTMRTKILGNLYGKRLAAIKIIKKLKKEVW